MDANGYAEGARPVFERLVEALEAVYEREGGVRPLPRTKASMDIIHQVAAAAITLSSEMPGFRSAPEEAARAVASMVDGVVAKAEWRKLIRDDAFDAADLWRRL